MDGVAPREGATVAAAAITPCQPRGKGDGDRPPSAAASEPEPSNPEAIVEGTSKDESIDAAKAPAQIQSQMALKMPDVPRLPVAISPGATVAANDNHFVASISCPDGSKVELSSDCCLSDGTDCSNNKLSSMLLGRGKNGIPYLAVHVSRSACAIRIVKRKMGIRASHGNGDDGDEGKEQTHKKPIYGLELVVVGSQPCSVTRMNTRRNADGGHDDDNISTTITLQVPSPLMQNDFGHTTCPLLDGDTVEPYCREDGVDCREFEKAGNYLPFVVGIAATTKGPVDASSRPHMTAFVEASKRIMREGEKMACADDTKKASSESQDTVSVMEENVADKAEVMKNPRSDSAGDDAADGTKSKPIESHVARTDDPMGEEKKESRELKLQSAAPAAHSAPEDQGTQEASERPSTKEKDVKEASSVSKVVAAPPKQEATQDMSSSSETEKSSEEDNDDFENPREDVQEILEGVDSPGSFATGGSCGGHLIMPGIEVDGVGIIGLPLSEAQAKSLAARCEQAPFGRGSETIVDKRVRNTFQLAPEHFKVTNPRWAGEISNLLSRVCRDLGVQTHLKIEAQLYKMLLYEQGSFFAMHRDSEKVDGMFGTLVIVLPTKFTGGELVVKHQGQVKEFSQSQSSNFGSQYASFYADCKHELKPVTSGHRLCLVYNLVKTGAGACPRAQRNRQILKRLKRAVHAWANAFDGKKLVIMTEHLYTPAGISGGGRSGTGSGGGSAKFKGNDAALVHLLEQRD